MQIALHENHIFQNLTDWHISITDHLQGKFLHYTLQTKRNRRVDGRFLFSQQNPMAVLILILIMETINLPLCCCSCLVPRRLSSVTSHSFRARLCHAKNEVPEEEAAVAGLSLKFQVAGYMQLLGGEWCLQGSTLISLNIGRFIKNWIESFIWVALNFLDVLTGEVL